MKTLTGLALTVTTVWHLLQHMDPAEAGVTLGSVILAWEMSR